MLDIISTLGIDNSQTKGMLKNAEVKSYAVSYIFDKKTRRLSKLINNAVMVSNYSGVDLEFNTKAEAKITNYNKLKKIELPKEALQNRNDH